MRLDNNSNGIKKGRNTAVTHTGGQSAIAIQTMVIATAAYVAVFTLFKLPTEEDAPVEFKQAITGSKSASKVEMMEAVCKRYGWSTQKK